MSDPIRAFLDRLDAELLPFAADGGRLDLYLLGRAALVLSYRFPLATKDLDVVELGASGLERQAVALAGKGSPLADALGLYLDPVQPGLPPLPRWFRKRSRPLAGDWQVLRVWQLEAHDLAATKLKSFRPQDRQDLQMLCDLGLLEADKLRESLEAAFPLRSQKTGDADDDPDNPDWGKALANCRRVEAYLQGERNSL